MTGSIGTKIVASAELLARRAAVATMPNGYSFDETVERSERMIGGVRCLVLVPPHPMGTLVYFHGGGFRLGTPERSAPFASQLAAASDCRIVLPAYGLAPENPFPAAFQQGSAVLRQMAGQGPIIIGGDSAGGNLATGLTRLHTSNLDASLKGLLLFSPWLDLTVKASSYSSKAASDPLFSQASATAAAWEYLQGHPADDPAASPLIGDVAAFPPSLIIVSGAEVLLDDSLAFAHKLATANREVALHVIPSMNHVAATLAPGLVGAKQSFHLAAAFLKHCLQGRA